MFCNDKDSNRKEADCQLEHGIFNSCNMRCFHCENNHKCMKNGRDKPVAKTCQVDHGGSGDTRQGHHKNPTKDDRKTGQLPECELFF